MEKQEVVIEEKKKTVTLVSYFRDFDGSLDEWQKAYFYLLAWKNTWNFTYAMDILSTNAHEAYLWMIPRDLKHKEQIIEMLQDLKYGNIIEHETVVGEYWCNDYEVEYLFEQ